ncbi:putative ATP-grasp target RiPP [Kribbella aluminosa]|uniref:ATP-grasp target RiPP n=1 Tax=Kribbella aluminosa TaxID=416017 RepID=A0ABS4UBF9_9ACTN|nr:putative ATP-grasp-modified RiPP [Kribbella aluminosa]MBP2348941.1 putative ATP-grasp target RiPP [Kribbella aluminosa]
MSDPNRQVQPWGIGRMGLYQAADPLPYVRVELDPVTQTATRYAVDGTVIEMKHGTSRPVRQPTQTPGPDGGDPRKPPDPDTDQITAYEPD